jgi:hypothetical protein
VTPYREGRIDRGGITDPSRPRFGLAGAAVGSLACFVALIDQQMHHFGRFDAVLLFGGSAAITILLAYSALDAPAGRGVLLAALAAFAGSFVPQVAEGPRTGSWVWALRYVALAGIAAGLLLRLRRTRPGTHGALLRLAGITAFWWGVQHVPSLFLSRAEQSARSELFSRLVYLFLAVGILDLRRWVGAVPARDARRTPIDAAREIATTRVCLGVVSVGAALSTSSCAWHSEWAVIATVQMVSALITVTLHLQWIWRESRLAVFVAVPALLAVPLALNAFDAPHLALPAVIVFATASVVADLAVVRFVAPLTKATTARSAFGLGLAAIALHLVDLAIVAARVG